VAEASVVELEVDASVVVAPVLVESPPVGSTGPVLVPVPVAPPLPSVVPPVVMAPVPAVLASPVSVFPVSVVWVPSVVCGSVPPQATSMRIKLERIRMAWE
jgi:hypothetical protein